MSKNNKFTFEIERDENGQPYFGSHKCLIKYIKETSPPRARKYLAEVIGFDEDKVPLFKYTPLFKIQPIGVVVAIVNENEEISYGWALCNFKMGDRFNKDRALKIALGRALTNPSNPPFDNIEPRKVREELRGLHTRATNYYKYLDRV